MAIPHLRLGVNVDHVATIRNARGGEHPDPLVDHFVATVSSTLHLNHTNLRQTNVS